MPRQEVDLIKWLIPRLRRISLSWPGKSVAREQAKVKVQIGVSKNGTPKYRVFYKCAECVREGKPTLWRKDETAMDHLDPVVDIRGFQSWNDFITKLFCTPSGYQCLCHSHHNDKTQKENITRKVLKKCKKVKK